MYKLLWQDLFLKDGLPDDTIWSFETGGHGFGNGEAQHYTDRIDNGYVKDGILTIEAKKEAYENNQYTSAKLITYKKKSIHYGRIEVMAELPLGKGTWPAIWFLGNNYKAGTTWPKCGEIDLMEHVGHNLGQIHFSLHSLNHNHIIKTQPTHYLQNKKLLEGFHEYAMEWEEDKISFFIDKIHQVTFSKKDSHQNIDWPFDKPHYLILNLALGGWWGATIDESSLPQKFRFKYVKVYERRD